MTTSPDSPTPDHDDDMAPMSKRSRRAQVRRTLRQDALNLPNALTMLRIVLIPVVLVLLERGSPRDCFAAAMVYTAAAITDFFDGYLARRQGLVSVLGKFLDPLADKLIVMASLIWMVTMGRIPAWIVVLLLSRDITITALRSIASSEGLVIAAGNEGKSKTAFQMVGIILLLIGFPYHVNFYVYDFGIVDLVHVGKALVYLSLFYSLLSAYKYTRFFVDAVEAKERRQSQHG